MSLKSKGGKHADPVHDVPAQADWIVQLLGGLAVAGERRSWVSELMMRLFEHLKVLRRSRLLLHDEDEEHNLVAFDPDAAEETPPGTDH